MKATIKSLNEALAYQLEGMYYAEKKLQKILPDLFDVATSRILKDEIKKYLRSAQDKRLKLKRIFSYLLVTPFSVKNNVINEMLKDSAKILKLTKTKELKDTLLMGRLQSIANYKISSYETAKAFASILELQNVIDLLQEVVEWEQDTGQAFTKIVMRDVNEKTA
jgi:ferritin-like metal-binding protein YciE